MIPCAKSELMIFNGVPVQSTMLASSWVDFHTISNVTNNNGPLDFNIASTQDDYLDLNDTNLYIRLRVKSNPEAHAIAPVNLFMHSLFQDVTVKLNDTIIQGGDQLYAYKAIINSLLLFDEDTKNTQLRLCGYYKDQPTKLDDKENTGFAARAKWIENKKEFEMMGPLHLDLMNQTRYILPQVSVSLRMTRNKSNFSIISYDAGLTSVQIEILEAILYVRRVKALSSVVDGHESGLLQNNALYPLQHMRMETFAVARGSHSFNRENIFLGKMPKFVVVAMVENAAFTGAFTKNPFNFQHFNVNFVGLYREGESIPYRHPYDSIDFANKRIVRPYMGMIQALEQFNRNDNNGITIDDYASGSTFFVYNLTPDLECGGNCQQAYRNGNLRLEMKFSSALAESINVIIYGVFDGTLEITKLRNIIMDY